MKKLLFTLAALVAFGVSAQPVVVFNNGTEDVTEITLEPGQSQEMTIKVVSVPQMVTGLQWNFTMFDENGNQLSEGCHLDLLEKYGTRDAWAWFGLNMVGNNGTVYNNGTAATSTNGTYHQTDTWDDEGDYMPDNDYGVEGVNVTYTGEYNVILANISANQVFTTRMSYPLQVLNFTVTIDEGWEGNYATLKMMRCDYSYSASEQSGELIELKINNNKPTVEPEQVAKPVVTFVENGDVLTVTVTSATEGASIWIDGVEHENPYIYTVNRTDEDQTINVVATAKKADMTDSEVCDTTYVFAKKGYATAPVISFNEDAAGVTITAEPATEVIIKVDGTVIEGNYVARTDADQLIEVEATNNPGGDNVHPVTVNDQMTLTAKPQTTEPVITWSAENGVLTIVATGEGEITLTFPVTREVATGTNRAEMTVNYDIYEGVDAYATATAQKPNEQVSEMAREHIVIAAQPRPSAAATMVGGEPTITDDTYTYEFAGNNVHVYINGEEVANPYTVNRPEAGEDPLDITFTVTTNDGEGYATTTTTFDVTVQPKDATPVQPQAEAPGVAVSYGTQGDHTAYVTITTDETDATIMYRVQFNDGEWSGWMEYTDVLPYTQNGRYTVEAYVKVPGKDDSDVNYVSFTVSPSTGMTDLMTGKTIANQRFFNLAGQEMQEVNGLTIVLTTYTDGTTSAVKVMK